jgi:hypothetical protein
MTLRLRFVSLAAFAFAFACGACSNNNGNNDANGDAGDDVDDGAPPPCTLAVDKGPWSLAIDETSAKVRWESCVPDVHTMTLTPPTGAPRTLTPVVTTTYVTHTDPAALIQEADLAGTYYMNEAQITGLDASTCYGYSVDGVPDTDGRFCTARKPGETFKFIAIGDTNPGLGVTPPMINLAYTTDQPDFTTHGGDIQYYSSGLETYGTWMKLVKPMLRTGGFYPAVGNHEDEDDGEKQEYYDRFWGGAGFDGTNEHYRFHSGGVWFFALDTEQDDTPTGEQGAWLRDQLANAKTQPGFRFSVVYFHRPWETCGDTGDDDANRIAWKPTFDDAKVMFVIQAHMHGYERFVMDGRTFLTAAGGGGALGDVNANTTRPECANRVASGRFFHTVLLEVQPGQVVGTVVDDTGATRDTFTQVVP